MKTYVNGAMVAADDALIPAADRGFTLGDGLFETIKVSQGIPLRLGAHLERLRAGCAVLRLPPPQDLAEAIAATIAANDLRTGALRLSVSRGCGPRGLLPPDPPQPNVIITAGPLPPALPPARAIVAQSVRRNPHSPLSRIKCLSYLDNVLARMEAADHGADDAVMLNTDGKVAETTIANLFIVASDGLLVTPPIADGALAGVRRAEVLRGMVALERSITATDILTAREAFLTNALSVRPLIMLDGQPIGSGEAGALGRRLHTEAMEE